MDLFGHSISGQQLASLAGLLVALVYWLFVLKGEYANKRWLRDALARRQAEQERQKASTTSKDSEPEVPPKGPWG